MNRICPAGHHYKGQKCYECRQPKNDSERVYDHKWNVLSKRYRTLHPLCEDCEAKGRITPCIEVHHIVPVLVDKSRMHDWNNLVAVCKACHLERHKEG